jgi:hypothetical protein
MTAHEQLRGAMSDIVGVPPQHVSLFWRSRVALYAILEGWDRSRR